MNMTGTLSFSLAAILAASFSLFSCGATGSVGAKARTPLPAGGHASLDFTVDLGGDTIAEVSGTPVCIELCYRGADGGDLGCSTIEVPGSDQVPEGAVSWSATVVECPDDGGSGGGGMFDPLTRTSSQQRVSAIIKPRHFEMFGGNIVPDVDGENVSYSFGIDALDLSAAKLRRDQVLLGGIGSSVGLGVQVAMWTESNTEFSQVGIPVGVRTRSALLGGNFQSFDMRVNGVLQADLLGTGNLLHCSAGNGWNVAETFVPLSAFATGPSYDNQADASWVTYGSSRVWDAMQRVWN